MGYEAEAQQIQDLFFEGKREEAIAAVPTEFHRRDLPHRPEGTHQGPPGRVAGVPGHDARHRRQRRGSTPPGGGVGPLACVLRVALSGNAARSPVDSAFPCPGTLRAERSWVEATGKALSGFREWRGLPRRGWRSPLAFPAGGHCASWERRHHVTHPPAGNAAHVGTPSHGLSRDSAEPSPRDTRVRLARPEAVEDLDASTRFPVASTDAGSARSVPRGGERGVLRSEARRSCTSPE